MQILLFSLMNCEKIYTAQSVVDVTNDIVKESGSKKDKNTIRKVCERERERMICKFGGKGKEKERRNGKERKN